jgi:hypothetical protein
MVIVMISLHMREQQHLRACGAVVEPAALISMTTGSYLIIKRTINNLFFADFDAFQIIILLPVLILSSALALNR